MAALLVCGATPALGEGSSNGFADRGVGISVTVLAAAPLGKLADDVNGHLGFGIGVQIPVRIGAREVLRPAFEWTGYRVSDRNWATRFLANLLDGSYEEDRLILRSYKLGADFQFFQDSDLTGTYFLFSGGLQRSRLYMERSSTNQNNESARTLGHSEPLNTLYLGAGLGYQWRGGGLVEFRYTNWRYRANPGLPLSETLAAASTDSREAHSLTLGLGARF